MIPSVSLSIIILGYNTAPIAALFDVTGKKIMDL